MALSPYLFTKSWCLSLGWFLHLVSHSHSEVWRDSASDALVCVYPKSQFNMHQSWWSARPWTVRPWDPHLARFTQQLLMGPTSLQSPLIDFFGNGLLPLWSQITSYSNLSSPLACLQLHLTFWDKGWICAPRAQKHLLKVMCSSPPRCCNQHYSRNILDKAQDSGSLDFCPVFWTNAPDKTPTPLSGPQPHCAKQPTAPSPRTTAPVTMHHTASVCLCNILREASPAVQR